MIALAAVEAFFGAGAQRQLDVDTVRNGFAAARSPGRLERMRSAPTVFIDAAHNPAGAEVLTRALTTEFGFRYLVGVVSVMGDKDVTGILMALEPAFDRIVVTHNGSPPRDGRRRLALRAEEVFRAGSRAAGRYAARSRSRRPPLWSRTRPRESGGMSGESASSSPDRW